MTKGLKDRESGATGVIRVQGTEGATMGPPAVIEYAVEPLGVATMSPSEQTEAMYPSSTTMSTVIVLL